MALIVEKFGGSSLADGEKLRNAAGLAASEYKKGNRLVVVVSARGDTTDRLLKMAGETGRPVSARELDVLLSTGEQASMALMAMTLLHMGIPAVSLCGWQAGIRTDAENGGARIESIDPSRITGELEAGRVAVVAGFQGLSPAGDITTIGRGGSDTTAVALAAALKADVCRIYTDVDGVYSADPRLVKNAVRQDAIGYDEMLELAAQGAQVLHSRAVEMAKRFDVQIEVRSSFQNGAGTRVGEVTMEKRRVSGAACDRNVALVTLHDVKDGQEAMVRLFSLLAERKISVGGILLPPAAQGGSIAFSLPRDLLKSAAGALEGQRESLGYGSLSFDERVCKLSVVGAGLSGSCGVASRMFEALHGAGVCVRCVTTGEVRISVIIDEADGEKALAAVHAAFF